MSNESDRTEEAARRADALDKAGKADPEPSLARRFATIGALGWIIIVPILTGLFIGQWLDKWLHTGITMAAALLMAGAALGFVLAWRWIEEQ
jgi:ATP synthase protein I